MRNQPSTAVVIGAGVAGLAAARVLADRVARVVVVDRDRLPEGAEPRRGVPQGAHLHTLLDAGRRALDELFPGFGDDAATAGAQFLRSGVDVLVHCFGTVCPRFPTGVQLTMMSRPLLELIIRRRVTALPNVVVRDRTAVAGLAGSGGRVTGVVLDDGARIPADLVVDASGRGSRSDRWLAGLGFAAPRTVQVKVGVGYASRLLRREPAHLGDASGVLVVPTAPHEYRMGGAMPIEGDRWIVCLGGWHGSFPTADAEAFDRHARSLPHPVLAELLESAEPLTDVVVHRFPSSRRRLFERLPDVPAGYLALGDAVAVFNPIYGQGMTAGVLQAQALGRVVDRHGVRSARMVRAFYRAAAAVVSVPWRFATGADFRYPETTGPRPPGVRYLNWYSQQVQRACVHSPQVRRTFVAVQHLLVPAWRLATPSVLAQVARSARLVPAGPIQPTQPTQRDRA